MRTYKRQSNFSFVVKNKRKNKNLTLSPLRKVIYYLVN